MAELIAIAAPAEQAEGTEMVVGTWLKNVGDAVTQNEPLLEVSTGQSSTIVFPLPLDLIKPFLDRATGSSPIVNGARSAPEA